MSRENLRALLDLLRRRCHHVQSAHLQELECGRSDEPITPASNELRADQLSGRPKSSDRGAITVGSGPSKVVGRLR